LSGKEVLERIVRVLPEEQIPNKQISVVSLDSTAVKAHQNASGGLRNSTKPMEDSQEA
jgi:hypothetical protein